MPRNCGYCPLLKEEVSGGRVTFLFFAHFAIAFFIDVVGWWANLELSQEAPPHLVKKVQGIPVLKFFELANPRQVLHLPGHHENCILGQALFVVHEITGLSLVLLLLSGVLFFLRLLRRLGLRNGLNDGAVANFCRQSVLL